jgi:hypothetical protein
MEELVEISEGYPVQFIKIKGAWSTNYTTFVSLETVWNKYLVWLNDRVGVDAARYAGQYTKFTTSVKKWIQKKSETHRPVFFRPSDKLVEYWRKQEEEETEPEPEEKKREVESDCKRREEEEEEEE